MILDDQTKLELVNLVKQAVNEAVEQHPLSPDELIDKNFPFFFIQKVFHCMEFIYTN